MLQKNKKLLVIQSKVGADDKNSVMKLKNHIRNNINPSYVGAGIAMRS